MPAGAVAFAEQRQDLRSAPIARAGAGAGAERAIGKFVGQHVVLDQPGGAFGDEAVERLEAGRYVICRIDRLADVVQQCGRQELLVVRQLVAGVVEHLQAVIQRVALRMILERLLHVLQRQQQRLEQLKAIDLVRGFLSRRGKSRSGYSRVRNCSSSAMLARSIGLPVIELLKT